ncbi:MAG: DUF4013 domain-containing protein [Eggerthellaceae bacterium]|nr:DUF4013 domain-containing protein [Eggerthellaceae bacterium]
MQTGYFKLAWGDIAQSRGWWKKLLLLSLVACIPVFGGVIVYGYAFGWAREMAWGVRRPLPARVFGNEDGKLYVRGMSVFAVTLVFSLVPVVVQLIGLLFTGGSASRVGLVADLWNDAWSWWIVGPVLGLAFTLASLSLNVMAVLFSWIGGMRASIYSRVSAGFQLGRIWAMLRYDTKGIVRILLMAVLWSLISGLVIALLTMSLVFVLTFTGLVVFDGTLIAPHAHFDIATVAAAIFGMVTASLAAAALVGYVSTLFNVFITLLCARALGYWVQPFEVARWRGQDDPMPFETNA